MAGTNEILQGIEADREAQADGTCGQCFVGRGCECACRGVLGKVVYARRSYGSLNTYLPHTRRTELAKLNRKYTSTRQEEKRRLAATIAEMTAQHDEHRLALEAMRYVRVCLCSSSKGGSTVLA